MELKGPPESQRDQQKKKLGRPRKFDDAFRHAAVERMKTCEDVSGLARELEVSRSPLYRWRDEVLGRTPVPSPKTAADIEEKRELHLLGLGSPVGAQTPTERLWKTIHELARAFRLSLSAAANSLVFFAAAPSGQACCRAPTRASGRNHRRHIEHGLFRASGMVSFHRHHSPEVDRPVQFTLGGQVLESKGG